MATREQISAALNPADFAAWLGSNPEREFHGLLEECGIACYLRDRFEERFVVCGTVAASGPSVEMAVVPTPLWAKAFITAHDQTYHRAQRAVSAPTALAILNDLCGPFPPQEFVGVTPFVEERVLQPA